MRHDGYFVIRAKSELIAQLHIFDRADLATPVLWTAIEPDRSSFSRTDRESLVKVLFVDSIGRYEAQEAWFAKACTRFARTEAFFDSLWTLERVRLDSSVEEALAEAQASGTLQQLSGTGNASVDEWLELHRQKLRS